MGRFEKPEDVARVREEFDRLHEEVFAFQDPASEVQFVGWRATVRCQLRERDLGSLAKDKLYEAKVPPSRRAYFTDTGMVETPVRLFETMKPNVPLEGPAIIESPLTTVVIEPGAKVVRKRSGSLIITP